MMVGVGIFALGGEFELIQNNFYSINLVLFCSAIQERLLNETPPKVVEQCIGPL